MKQQATSAWQLVVVGVSAGGLEALSNLLANLPADLPAALAIVQHLPPGRSGYLVEALARRSKLKVNEAEEKENIETGHVYLASPDYHLLVERDGTLALSVDARVNFSRPSIDVLFESAARNWPGRLFGVILTGANADGAQGLKLVRQAGGITLVQDPVTAERPEMPRAAIAVADPHHIADLAGIAGRLSELTRGGVGGGGAPVRVAAEAAARPSRRSDGRVSGK